MFMKPLFILNLGFKIENERSAVDNTAATPTAPFVTADVAAHVRRKIVHYNDLGNRSK